MRVSQKMPIFAPMNQKKRKERITDAERKEAYKEASKFVLDLAKLVFAGVILAGIMDMDITKGNLLSVGLVVVTVLIVSGAYLYYRAIKNIDYDYHSFFDILGISGFRYYYLVCIPRLPRQ